MLFQEDLSLHRLPWWQQHWRHWLAADFSWDHISSPAADIISQAHTKLGQLWEVFLRNDLMLMEIVQSKQPPCTDWEDRRLNNLGAHRTCYLFMESTLWSLLRRTVSAADAAESCRQPSDSVWQRCETMRCGLRSLKGVISAWQTEWKGPDSWGYQYIF